MLFYTSYFYLEQGVMLDEVSSKWIADARR